MTQLPTSTRQVVLASRPQGAPSSDNFRLETVDLPQLADGEVLVRNVVMSLDPYMRGRMNDVKSYVAPFEIDAPLDGGAVGEVIASRSDDVAVGQHVLHGLGWREHAVLPAKAVRVVDTDVAPASTYLGVLGLTGLTAYVGLTAVAGMREGDTVFVSGAAGAVGQAAGQIAKALGAGRVVGSAGSADKVARVVELGYDAAFSYRDGPVAEGLASVAPDGIDVYFDNVGGELLDAALANLAHGARIAVCGAISTYNDETLAEGPRRYMALLVFRASMQGFVVMDYEDRYGEAIAGISELIGDGRFVATETILEGGVPAFPDALLGLFDGVNTGKLLLEI